MSNKRTQLNINISPESLQSLRSRAIKSGRTLGSLVNEILNEYIQENLEEEIYNKAQFIKRIELLEIKIEDLNKKFVVKNNSELTFNEELAERYTQLMREDFHNVKRTLDLTGEELFIKLSKTDKGKILDKIDLDILKNIMNNEYSFSPKYLQFMFEKYNTLPCFAAIKEVIPSPQLIEFCEEVGLCK